MQLQDLMKKASPAAIADNKQEMAEWETELERLQSLRPVLASKNQIQLKELPMLEKEIKEQEHSYPDVSREAEEVSLRLKFTNAVLKLFNLGGGNAWQR